MGAFSKKPLSGIFFLLSLHPDFECCDLLQPHRERERNKLGKFARNECRLRQIKFSTRYGLSCLKFGDG